MNAFDELAGNFSRLPGIGKKSAVRMQACTALFLMSLSVAVICYMPIPIPAPAGIGGWGSLMVDTTLSVVRSVDATEVAF